MTPQNFRLIPRSWLAHGPQLLAGTLFGILAVATFATPASAQTIYNDGGTHTFGSGTSDPDGIKAENGTTFIVNSGAVIGSSTTSSQVGVELDDTSTLTATGGTFVNGYFALLDTSTGTSSISGGTFSSGYYNIAVNGKGILNITGGNFNGGSHTLSAQHVGSVINIYGTGLTLSGDQITGTLQDGESINVSEANGDGGQINLINSPDVPEPDPRLLLGGGLALLGVGTWRRQRRA